MPNGRPLPVEALAAALSQEARLLAQKRHAGVGTVVALLVMTYLCLILGIVMEHAAFRVVRDGRITVHTDTGIWQLICGLLLDGSRRCVALGIVVAIWGIVVPLVQLFTTVLALLFRGAQTRRWVELASSCSKCAFVDAFIAVFWAGIVVVAYGAGEEEEEGNEEVEGGGGDVSASSSGGAAVVNVKLKLGFYCFLAHCVLAQVTNHLVLMMPRQEAEQRPLLTNGHVASGRRGWGGRHDHHPVVVVPSGVTKEAQALRGAALAAAGTLVIFVIMISQPVLFVQSPAVSVERGGSIVQLVAWLWDARMWPPACCLLVLAIAGPFLELCMCLAEACGATSNPMVEFWVQSFSMFDVLMVGLVVSALTCSTVFGSELRVLVTEAGWLAATLAGAWGLSRHGRRCGEEPPSPPPSSPFGTRSAATSGQGLALASRCPPEIVL